MSGDLMTETVEALAALVDEYAERAVAGRIVAPSASILGKALRVLALHGKVRIINHSDQVIMAEWVHMGETRP